MAVSVGNCQIFDHYFRVCPSKSHSSMIPLTVLFKALSVMKRCSVYDSVSDMGSICQVNWVAQFLVNAGWNLSVKTV